ncbi:MAG: Calx-beta domain-containing protein [Chloroflexota bacterium]
MLSGLLAAMLLVPSAAFGQDQTIAPAPPRRIEIQGGRFVLDGRPISVPVSKLRLMRALPGQVLPPIPRGAPQIEPGQPSERVRPPSRAGSAPFHDLDQLAFRVLTEVGTIVRAVTVGANIDASNLTFTQSEATVIIDPRNPNRAVAASNDIFFAPVATYATTDGGLTWTYATPAPPLPGIYEYASDPVVAADLNGNFFASYLGVRPGFVGIDVIVSKSADGGFTWGPAVNVTNAGDNDRDWMAIDTSPSSSLRNNIYIVWQVPGDGVRFSRSTDGGSTFSSPVRVDSVNAQIDATGNVIYTMVAVAPNGDVYVTWEDYKGLGNVASTLFMRRSTDGGQTWGTQVAVTDTRVKTFSPGTFIPANANRGIGPIPAVAVDSQNVVHFVYGDRASLAFNDFNTDIYYRRSTDFGATWSAAAKLNDDATTTSQFYPWLAVDRSTDTLHVNWYDVRGDALNNHAADVYYTRSRDRGLTFEPNTRITTVASDLTQPGADFNQFGDVLGIAALCDIAIPAWTDGRLLNNPQRREETFTARVIGETTPCSGNQPPVVVTTVAPLSYTENSGAVPVDSALLVTDSDSASLASGTVQIVVGYQSAQDTLSLPATPGLTSTYNTATGTLTITGPASVAAYQAALRTVRYTNGSDNPTISNRTVSFAVSDGQANSNPASRVVSVVAVNDPPFALADNFTALPNATLTVAAPGVLANDVDPDSATLTASVVTPPTHGTVTMSSNGAFTYVPALDYVGPDSFTYVARDASAASPVATVTLNVSGPGLSVNDVTVSEGGAGTKTAQFTVTLAGTSTAAVTVQVTAQAGTATAGSDFLPPGPLLLTFQPGVNTQVVNVTVVGDALDEDDETFRVILSQATNSAIVRAVGTATIVDDDAVPAIIVSPAVVTPSPGGGGTATFVVTLSSVSGRQVLASFATVNGTAVAGTHFVPSTGTLVFAPGEMSKTVTVILLPNGLADGLRSFDLSITGVPPSISGATVTASATLQGVAPAQPEHEDGKERRLTETQRQQRKRTNQLGLDDYRIEGNVLSVDPAANPPTATIGTRDGLVMVILACDGGCAPPVVGGYLEADGVKENEGLFTAENVTVRR